MKKIITLFLLLIFMFSLADEAHAQRRGKKKRRPKKENVETIDTKDNDTKYAESSDLKDKLNIEIKMGNVQFFGSIFQAALKSNVGYKFNKTFSAGLGGKFDYYYRSVPGPGDKGFFNYGGLVYGRAKLSSEFYVQAEYNAFSSAFDLPRKTFTYPSAGIGYIRQGLNWSSGIELLVPFNDNIRDRFGVVEYWISFSRNF